MVRAVCAVCRRHVPFMFKENSVQKTTCVARTALTITQRSSWKMILLVINWYMGKEYLPSHLHFEGAWRAVNLTMVPDGYVS